MPGARYAILIDGDFMKRRLAAKLKRFPKATDVLSEVSRIRRRMTTKDLGHRLYRVFYYTADPLNERRKNPLSGRVTNFASTKQFRQNQSLIDALEQRDLIAVRRGELVFRGWALTSEVNEQLIGGKGKQIAATDLRPNIEQKGVDMRIGLDIASLAFKRIVSGAVLVAGDADMVPALKLARREGLSVYLDRMSMGGCKDLCIHSDVVLDREP